MSAFVVKRDRSQSKIAATKVIDPISIVKNLIIIRIEEQFK